MRSLDHTTDAAKFQADTISAFFGTLSSTLEEYGDVVGWNLDGDETIDEIKQIVEKCEGTVAQLREIADDPNPDEYELNRLEKEIGSHIASLHLFQSNLLM